MVQEISQGSAILSTRYTLSVCLLSQGLNGLPQHARGRSQVSHSHSKGTRYRRTLRTLPETMIIGQTHESGSHGRDYHLREGFAIAAG